MLIVLTFLICKTLHDNSYLQCFCENHLRLCREGLNTVSILQSLHVSTPKNTQIINLSYFVHMQFPFLRFDIFFYLSLRGHGGGGDSKLSWNLSFYQRNIAKEPFISTETICSTFGDRSEGSLWFHIWLLIAIGKDGSLLNMYSIHG